MPAPDPSRPVPPAAAGAADDDALYQALRVLARERLRSAPSDATLGTTQLVHESWLRLQARLPAGPEDRAAFLVRAGRVMRAVIVDLAMLRVEERRSDGTTWLPGRVDPDALPADDGPEADILRVHDALRALEAVDARMAGVVELRYFGGLSDPEIADALDITERMVRRDWEHARLILAQALG